MCLAVHDFIYICNILNFKSCSLRNNQTSFHRNRKDHISRCSAIQQPILIREYGTQTRGTRITVYHPTDGFNTPLFAIHRLVIQLQFHFRHIFQRFCFGTILTGQSQQLIFSHRKINIHIRIIRNRSQRLWQTGTNQCTYPIRQCTNHPVRRTFHLGI